MTARSLVPLPLDWSPSNLPRRWVEAAPSPSEAPRPLSDATARRLIAIGIAEATPMRRPARRERPDWPVILVGIGLAILIGAAVLA